MKLFQHYASLRVSVSERGNPYLLKTGLLRLRLAMTKPLTICLILSACALGDDYAMPKFDFPIAWQEAKPIAASTKTDLDQEWWKNFDDATLNDLITKARANNLDVKIAITNIKQARAQYAGVIANQLPDITANGSATRTKNSKNTQSPDGAKPFNAFNLGFDASWEADIFGGRRAIEAADASLEATEESAHDVEISLLGDVASNYIAVRSYQTQIKVAEANLAAQNDTLILTKSRAGAGLLNDIDVAQAESLVQNTQSNIPTLRAQMRQSLHSLEILLGEQPNTLEELVTPSLRSEAEAIQKGKDGLPRSLTLTRNDEIISPVPISTHEIILGAPADIIRNRPDIREAERNLASATAVQGVAISEMFPKISITSMFGLGASQTSNLLNIGSKTWSIGGGAVLPILDFGRIRADINIADAKQEQAFLTYQKTVLNALKEVENALVAYTQEKDRLDILTKAVASSELAAQMIDKRYSKGGLISFLNVLDAKRSLYAAQTAQTQSRASLATDLVVLYKALGGGWKTAE